MYAGGATIETEPPEGIDRDAIAYAIWLPWARKTETWVLTTVLDKTPSLSAGAQRAIKDVLKERGIC